MPSVLAKRLMISPFTTLFEEFMLSPLRDPLAPELVPSICMSGVAFVPLARVSAEEPS